MPYSGALDRYHSKTIDIYHDISFFGTVQLQYHVGGYGSIFLDIQVHLNKLKCRGKVLKDLFQ